MRTKTLLLTAALSIAAAATSMAQAVYSVNIVGYVNLQIPRGFSMIANQLKNSPDNKLTTVLPSPPFDTEVSFFVGSSFHTLTYLDGIGWDTQDPQDLNLTLAPGQGAFINAPSAFTATFVGEVLTGNVTVPVASGFSIIASAVPQAGLLQTDLKYTPIDNDEIQKWNGTSFTTYTYLGGWELEGDPVEPSFLIGEAFFANSGGPANRTWIRAFNP